MRAICFLAALTMLTGCDRAAGPSSGHGTASQHPVEIDATTPDLAVKSWWRVLDAYALFNRDYCLGHRQERSPIAASADKILSGDAMEYFSKPDRNACVLEEFTRTMDEVRIESDSRAIVLATVRNSTPLAQGAHLDGWTAKAREKGERFKYILERASAQDPWRIAQVFQYETYAVDGDNWRLEYDPKYVNPHAIVVGQ